MPDTPMSGLDASFLYAEGPSTPMHTLKVLALELPPTRAPRAWILDRVERAVALLPALRVRPRSSLLGHPVWEPVAVDVAEHVRFERLWPHGERSLEDAIGAHLSTPLRRDRPLFEVLVVEEGRRRVTLAVKIHHAVADGRAAEHMLEVLAGCAARPRKAREEEPVAHAWRLLSALLSFFPTLLDTIRGVLRARRLPPSIRPFGGPATSLDRPVSATRRVAFVSLPLDAIRATKRAHDATVNDVVLSLVAGAMRRVLALRGERVDRPLVGAMPVGVGPGGHAYGNALSHMLVPIHAEEPDPIARLAKSAASARRAKARHAATGPDLLARWSRFGSRFAVRAFFGLLRHLRRAPAQLIVSNVPGPADALGLDDAKLVDVFSAGPLLETTGLNITFWSYAGRMNGCVLASDGVDPAAVATAIREAFAELADGPQRHSIAA